MGTNELQNGNGAEDRKSDTAYYVYCVGESATLEQLRGKNSPSPIEPESEIKFVLINGEALTAITSLVPLADYDEEALRARLEDATWTAVRAMRHERVVEFFAREASVVPLRFGTIYLDRAGVEGMLYEKREELHSIIERLRDSEEWGVNVYCDRARVLDAITSLSPRLRELAGAAERATPGQAYLMRKKIEAMRADEARDEIKRVAKEIEMKLSSLSAGAVRLRVLKDEASAEHGDTVMKLAFLVPKERFNDFRAEAERLADENLQGGFKLELTGPWPAYNFT
ncbi:MAG TPA: GvpL/GvpF family gas vesicle protein [Pyrinomonadaceae bacterium]|nr:GvpL/GvpF family gas vesicle protein [Pyrinomonadaceae bacterium]